MGFAKEKRPVHTAGLGEVVQNLTQATTATKINGYGTTIIISSGPTDKTWVLRAPLAKGVQKTLICDNNSTGDMFVITHSTAVTFLGTTHATLKFSTGAAAGVHPKRARLVASSGTQWALLDLSTGVSTQA
jgi:hypothetical protein